MKVRLVHTAVICWEISDSCTNVTKFEVKQDMPGLTTRGMGGSERLSIMKEKFKTENMENKVRNAFISGSFIIPKTINYYSFLVDIVPKIGYPIEGREVQYLCI